MMNGMQGMQGNVEMRNMMAEQFLNRAPTMNQNVERNMMMPYFPMHHNNLQGAFNSCGNEMFGSRSIGI